MSTTPDAVTQQTPFKSTWPLALCAGLLGIGQNGLLVVLPQLVSMTGLSLSAWAGLLMFGSMLFLPASPWWGRQAEIRGCKFVVLAALLGYLASFAVLALVVWSMASGKLGVAGGMAGLIVSRTLYGLTVSGMVPAAQTWAMQRAGTENRMAALASISSGLSCGRLLGPPLAAAALSLHPQAPLWLMALAPLLALMTVVRQPNDPPLPPVAHQSTRLQLNMLPYLLLALLLAACISLMQLGLSPHLKPLFPENTTQISHHVAWLLSLAAVSTLLAQFLVVRPQRLSAGGLLAVAAVLLVCGLALMSLPGLVTFYIGIVVTSLGSAMATPGYQLLLNDRLSTGKGAGVIATSHTLGYGLSALLVPLVSGLYGEQALIGVALALAAGFLALSGGVCWRKAR
ncbi:MFS transporter [Trabulsiella odontotermitis]|uniref:MFS transporter n=1 Tax=Trabulsiella odontotermitis TaxID=379893 RepID=UPI0024B854C7|nr:MFS transporter [Trabulsiella odontotermitis]WHP29650.1 MFS transporter [Trabulsiella odontotermitis]